MKEIKKSDFFWWKLEVDIFVELEESLYWKLEALGINSYSFEISSNKPFDLILVIWLPSYEWSRKDQIQLELCLESLAAVFNKQLVNFFYVEGYNSLISKYYFIR